MMLDEATKAVLDHSKASGAPALYEMSVADARTALKTMTATLDMPATPVAAREERTITGPNGGIPVRIYWPPRSLQRGHRLPLLLHYHGGGHALGDLDTHDNICRYYCAHGDVIVVSVDYRLSPEHKFPAGIEDCYAALQWAAAQAHGLGANPARIAVTGDSAGGNLSAVVCQLAKARSGPQIAYQVLVYPAVDMTTNVDAYDSRRQFGSGDYFLSQKDAEWLAGMYFRSPADADDTRASPILTPDLKGLPPALVITAGFDPLRDEGKQYAERLTAAGVEVEYRCFETTIHGFLSFAGQIPAGRELAAFIAGRLKERLAAW